MSIEYFPTTYVSLRVPPPHVHVACACIYTRNRLVTSLEYLRAHSPVRELVVLGTAAAAQQPCDSLTLSLVFSCLANLAARLVPVLDQAASVGKLLARSIKGSGDAAVEAAGDSVLLGYALAAAFNLSASLEVSDKLCPTPSRPHGGAGARLPNYC